MAEALLTQLLLDKMQRDRALKERDAAWARDDARYNQQRQDRLDVFAYNKERDRKQLERQAELDRFAAEERAFTRAARELNMRRDNTVRIGSIGDLAQGAMTPTPRAFGVAQAAEYSDPEFGSTGVGETLASRARLARTGGVVNMPGIGMVQPKTQAELQQEQINAQRRAQLLQNIAFENETNRMIGRTNMATQRINTPEGMAGMSSFNPNTGSVGFARPVQPPQTPRGAVTDAQNARVNAAVQRYVQGDPTKGQTGTNPALLQAEDLPGEAAFIAEREGVPFDDVFRLLKMMFDSNRSRDTGSNGGGGMFDTYMQNRGGGSAPPLG